MKYLYLCLLVLLIFSGCKKDEEIKKTDDQIIKEYLEENEKEATLHHSGMYYKIIEEGSGDHPTHSSIVEVKYKGYFMDNFVFDQTWGSETFKYSLTGLIPGWQHAIPLLRKGGKGIFYLPSRLGYGSRGAGMIPPNTILIFEIELVDFE